MNIFKLARVQNYLFSILFITYSILVFILGMLWISFYSLFKIVIVIFIQIIQPQLHSAVLNKNMTKIDNFLKKGGNINSVGIADKTGLHLAINLKNYELTKFLLERGANVNCQDKYQVTPLHIAIVTKQRSLIDLLVSYGATNDIFTNTLQRNLEALQNYLRVGGDSNVKVGKKRHTLLEFAIKAHSLEMVELLLNKGANVNYRNHDRFTPLYIAACEGQFAISEALISQGAKIDAICQKQTILYRAVCSGNKYLVELLLQRGAKINLKYHLINSYVLHQAVAQGNFDIVELLINYGAKIDLRNELPFRETPLHLAIERGDLKIVKLLLSRGADVRLKAFFPLTDSLEMAVDYPDIYNLIKSHKTKNDFAIFNPASQENVQEVGNYYQQSTKQSFKA